MDWPVETIGYPCSKSMVNRNDGVASRELCGTFGAKAARESALGRGESGATTNATRHGQGQSQEQCGARIRRRSIRSATAAE